MAGFLVSRSCMGPVRRSYRKRQTASYKDLACDVHSTPHSSDRCSRFWRPHPLFIACVSGVLGRSSSGRLLRIFGDVLCHPRHVCRSQTKRARWSGPHRSKVGTPSRRASQIRSGRRSDAGRCPEPLRDQPRRLLVLGWREVGSHDVSGWSVEVGRGGLATDIAGAKPPSLS